MTGAAEQLLRDCELGPQCNICKTIRGLLDLLASRDQELQQVREELRRAQVKLQGTTINHDEYLLVRLRLAAEEKRAEQAEAQVEALSARLRAAFKAGMQEACDHPLTDEWIDDAFETWRRRAALSDASPVEQK